MKLLDLNSLLYAGRTKANQRCRHLAVQPVLRGQLTAAGSSLPLMRLSPPADGNCGPELVRIVLGTADQPVVFTDTDSVRAEIDRTVEAHVQFDGQLASYRQLCAADPTGRWIDTGEMALAFTGLQLNACVIRGYTLQGIGQKKQYRGQVLQYKTMDAKWALVLMTGGEMRSGGNHYELLVQGDKHSFDMQFTQQDTVAIMEAVGVEDLPDIGFNMGVTVMQTVQDLKCVWSDAADDKSEEESVVPLVKRLRRSHTV